MMVSATVLVAPHQSGATLGKPLLNADYCCCMPLATCWRRDLASIECGGNLAR
jgi:hypothetical protein